MKNKNFWKKKAIATSILTVLIMCLASTVVPAIHETKVIETHYNVQNSSFNTKFYKKTYSLFREQLQNDKNDYKVTILNTLYQAINKQLIDNLLEVSSSKFLQEYDFDSLLDSTKSENLKIAISRIIPILKQMQNIVNYNGDSFESNPQLVTLIDRFNSEVESKPINDASDDFQWYWTKYTEAVEYWGQRFNVETWQGWFNAIQAHIDQIFESNIVPLTVSLALCTIPETITSFFGWMLLAAILYQVYDFGEYISEGFTRYTVLIGREADIIIRVVENPAEENGELKGIDGLWETASIVAISTDAVALCNGSLGFKERLFTYYLGPSNGTKDCYSPLEQGWYSLKNRNITEKEDRDYKAPHPPGSWTIEIKETPEYKGTIIEIDNVPKDGTYVIKEIKLDPK